jgi:hypothetical protein
MEFVPNQNPNFVCIHFGSIDIQIWGRYRVIIAYFWIHTLEGTKSLDKIHTFIFFFFDELPYISLFQVVGLLLRARKYKLVEFEGETLFQGRDTKTPVFLIR